VVPVGLARVLVEAVGEGLPGERAEVAVKRRVLLGQRADDRQVGHGLVRPVVVEVGVVADREGVRRGELDARVVRRGGRPLQEAVELAVVVLDEPAFPAVVRVAVPAALEVRGERVVGVGVAVDRGHELEVVPSVGPGEPAEEVVERAVFHQAGCSPGPRPGRAQ
jgi:hypothetical protein